MSDGPQRIETGCVQFDNDWPGIFIRGDHALMGYAPALRAVLAGEDGTWGLRKAEARGLLSLLESCRADAAKPVRLTVRADLPRPQDAARIAELEAALRRAHILLAANLGFVKGSAEAAIEDLGGFAEAMALAGKFQQADSGAAE